MSWWWGCVGGWVWVVVVVVVFYGVRSESSPHAAMFLIYIYINVSSIHTSKMTTYIPGSADGAGAAAGAALVGQEALQDRDERGHLCGGVEIELEESGWIPQT
jgi:hypothetical protein